MTLTKGILVASYNMHKAVGLYCRRDPARIAAVIAEIGADILALQEADMRFGDRAGLLDLAALDRDLGLVPVPKATTGRAHGFHGNLLLVRNALVQEAHRITLPGLEPRGAMITDLMVAGQPLRVVSAHLGLLAASRRLQVHALLTKLKALDPRPTLLMGDLNEWRSGPGSSIGSLMEHLPNAPALRSFPTRYPLLTLDRMMASGTAMLVDAKVHDTALSRRASDHLPIKAWLHLPPTAGGPTR